MQEQNSVTMSVGASRDDIEDVLLGLRAGEGLERLEILRREHGKARADLLNLLWRKEIPVEHKQTLEDLLIENRLREEYIERSSRAAWRIDTRPRMAELASSSNNIAEQANLTAAR